MSEHVPTPDDAQIDPELAHAVEEALRSAADAAASGGTDAGQSACQCGGACGDKPASQPDDVATSDASAEDNEEEALSELDQVKADMAQAADDLARAHADLYNLQQEYQGFVRRSREGAAGHRQAGQTAVVEALIPVLDEVELARQHGDLTGPFAAVASKLESILADKFSLERFGAQGDTFDPTLHEALMAVESDEVDEPTIAMVMQPGYRLGERVVRAARVQVANPAS